MKKMYHEILKAVKHLDILIKSLQTTSHFMTSKVSETKEHQLFLPAEKSKA